jgi:hypothetical protein
VEVFLQVKTALAVRDAFLRAAPNFSPIMGLRRKTGDPLPRLPTMEDAYQIANGKKRIDPGEFTPDYCYWFASKAEKSQRELFFGHGGTTLILLKPDPGTRPLELPVTPAFRKKNKLFQAFDVEKILARAYSLGDTFLAKSKDLFGGGLSDEPQYPGLLFILPLLATTDFFDQPIEECDKWFRLFDVYVNESPADRGVLMASGVDFEEPLIGLLKQMREEGLKYDEGVAR